MDMRMLYVLLIHFLFLIERGSAQDRRCGRTGMQTQTRGTIQLPSYRRGNYGANMECDWQIQSETTDQVTYTVRDINMENGGTCLNDYLEITFSNREPQKICGRRPPRRPISGA